MKVRIWIRSPFYWYKEGEIYDVEPTNAIQYKVSDGVRQGKLIYIGHTMPINTKIGC